MKFIHCADLHLDTAFSGLKDEKSAEIRQAELRRTFLKIIDISRDKDALVISGDLFDQDSVEAETIHTLAAGFASLENTKVLIAAGNHDPLTERSYYRLAAFSPNVHVFGPTIERVRVADCDVYGVSFQGPVQKEPLFKNFRAEAGRPSVLVMHGDLGGGPYNPVDREAVAKSGLAYLALGHVHSHEEIRLEGTLCVYPGCPEGRGFDELGEKGVVSVHITDEGTKTQFIPVCLRRYRELKVNVDGLLTHDAIIQRLSELVTEKSDLYKIILEGETELVPNTDVITEAFFDCFFLKAYDRTRRPIDAKALAAEPGLKGLFAQKILAGLEGDQAALYRKALEYGLSALHGEKVKTL